VVPPYEVRGGVQAGLGAVGSVRQARGVFLLADAGVDPVFYNLSNLRAPRSTEHCDEKDRENATTVEPHYSNYLTG
jgi:hypothetical protein